MFLLYYFPNNASLAPHLLLKELGASYELALVDRSSNAQKSSEYLRLNPLGRIPTLVDKTGPNDVVIFESAAICIHLCESMPPSGLIPLVGDSKRPSFLQWMLFLTNTLQAELMLYFYPGRHLLECSCDMDTEGSSGGCQNCTEGLKKTQETRVSQMLQTLDNHLESSGGYMLGTEVSACDFYLFMLALWTDKFSKPAVNYHHLGGMLRKIASRDAVREVCGIEEIDLSSLCP